MPTTIIKKVQPSWMLDEVKGKCTISYLKQVQQQIAVPYPSRVVFKKFPNKKASVKGCDERPEKSNRQEHNMNEVWARVVDLPGLEDNISPNNNITDIVCVNLIEFTLVFSRSSDSTDRQYLMLRLGMFALDLAFMTYGPAYQLSLNNILLTDKFHTTTSGQYLDLLYSPFPSSVDVLSVLYRKVSLVFS